MARRMAPTQHEALMAINRRNFIAGASALAFGGIAIRAYSQIPVSGISEVEAYGELVADKSALLDLPKGFWYQVISQYGETMSDGLKVGDRADGMGCFSLGDGRVALVRNHELKIDNGDTGPFSAVDATKLKSYDRLIGGNTLPGGTSTIIYDMRSRRRLNEFQSLAGTIRNCAGGVTPWGSWLTCEEDVTSAGAKVGRDHGFVFEVPARARGLVEPVPLRALGRFNHEAAAVDPRTGIVYLTEDREDSLFYRFLPNTRGELAKGGRLQAMVMAETKANPDLRNWTSTGISTGAWKRVTWIDLDGVDSANDDLRKRGARGGAALFARGEGTWWGKGEAYFCATSGGAKKLGQIFRYRPMPEGSGWIQNFVESKSEAEFNYGDNLTVTPHGHLIVCEDQYTDVVRNHLRGVTPEGRTYVFARLHAQTEMAGACFSPDGSTMFVNVYSPTKTLAITGPWRRFNNTALI